VTQHWNGVPRNPAFSRETLTRRVHAVQEEMRKSGIDLMLVSDFPNLYYLSGLDSIAQYDFLCVAVPAEGDPLVLINEFYEGIYHHVAGAFPAVTYDEFQDPIAILMDGVRKIASDARAVAYDNAWPNLVAKIGDAVTAALPGATMKSAFGIVERVRMIKDAAELDCMKKAAALTEIGIVAAAKVLAPGRLDCEAAAEAIAAMYRAGSDSVPLGPIVCGGYRGGIPYSTFDGYQLKAGDNIFVELTGSVRRYTAPLMRTFVLGKPGAEVAETAEASRRAVEAIMRTAKHGANAGDVAKAALGELSIAMQGKLYHNIVAYPVGIAYPPSWVERLDCTIKADSRFTLREGMVFHLPMSLRKLGHWALGLSQTVVVGAEGATPLGKTPARLQEL
jgi:Xaa-Pro dipeptidase